jgi:DNA polymerase
MTEPERFDASRLQRALVQHLECLQRAGISVVGRVKLPEPVGAASPPPGAAGESARRAARPPGSGIAGRTAREPTAPTVANDASPVVATGSSPATSTPEPTPPAMADPSRSRSARGKSPAAESLFDKPTAGGDLSLDQRREALQVLSQQVAACTRCPELVAHRNQTVFGVGNPQPRLCFFGEAPGADEDRQGEPFVGRAGQLLNKIIEACGLRREDVYILNVLKCRPPNNRDPAADEAANCRGYFERQIEILRPEFICCLGRPAMLSLLNPPPSTSLRRMRGKLHNYRDARVLVTYHPAYLLRNPAAKRDTWEDMQLLMREMGIEIPRPKKG